MLDFSTNNLIKFSSFKLFFFHHDCVDLIKKKFISCVFAFYSQKDVVKLRGAALGFLLRRAPGDPSPAMMDFGVSPCFRRSSVLAPPPMDEPALRSVLAELLPALLPRIRHTSWRLRRVAPCSCPVASLTPLTSDPSAASCWMFPCYSETEVKINLFWNLNFREKINKKTLLSRLLRTLIRRWFFFFLKNECENKKPGGGGGGSSGLR